MSLFKPAPPHNPLQAPAICLCVDCCRIVAKLRCTAVSKDGQQCGNYKHDGNEHWTIVTTVFQIVDERLAAASAVDLETRGEELARRFHELYEELAPQHGYTTRKESAVPWADVPAQNKALMTHVAMRIIEEDGL